jgi:hypothetical protein
VLVTFSKTERNALVAEAATRLSIAQSKTSISIAHPDGAARFPRAAEYSYGASGTIAGSGASRARHVTWFGDEFMVIHTTRAARSEPDRTEYAEGWLLQEDGSLRIEVVDNQSADPASRRIVELIYRRN